MTADRAPGKPGPHPTPISAPFWAAASDGGVVPEGWLDDSFHPSATGHHELARTLLRALGIHDDASEVCSLPIDEPVRAGA